MRLNTSFLKRSVALVLALVLLVSSSNLGVALQVFAVESENKVSAGELVAENYDLTDAEKNLLSSGMLVGDTYEYTAPSDSDLITIDTENTKITAAKAGEWVPTTAKVIANGEVKETIALTDGVGYYDESVGNAFSVAVTYELTQEVPADVQETLLATAGLLKDGLATLANVADLAGSLYILEEAMPELAKYAENGIPAGNTVMTLESKDNLLALNKQMTKNGGKLDKFAAASTKWLAAVWLVLTLVLSIV